jgi:FkbM family methyltransferase
MFLLHNLFGNVVSIFTKFKNRRQILSFYRKFINSGDLCFDVGANVGDKSDIFCRLGARVIAVEPQPLCVDKIRERFQSYNNIEILNLALGRKSGVDEMYVCSNINVLSTMSKKWIEQSRFSSNNKVKWDEKIQVSVTTLDELIIRFGVPKFCKIDVEGFEIEIFSGLTKKMKYLSFEFMSEFLDDALEITILLEKIGNIKCNYSLREDFDLRSFSTRGWRSCSDVIDELKIVDDNKLWGDIYIMFEE